VKIVENILKVKSNICFARHLRCVHQIAELNNHPQRSILREKFTILKNLGRGICKKCKKEIDFISDAYLLENHLRICQDNNSIYKKMNELASRYEIWKKYRLMDVGFKMMCIKCQYELKIVVSRCEKKLFGIKHMFTY